MQLAHVPGNDLTIRSWTMKWSGARLTVISVTWSG